LLQLLSSPHIHDLLSNFDAQRLPNHAALDGLLLTAGSAAAHHDVPIALAALTEYVKRNPEHALTLPSSPNLSAIRGDVTEMLRQIETTAKTEAVRLIGAAGEVVGAATRHPEKMDGPGTLVIAEQLVESGQLANYYRAAELSEAVIAFYARAVPEMALDAGRRADLEKPRARMMRERAMQRLFGAFWRRVPLLVLLVGWLAVGVAGGTISVLARAAGVELVSSSTLQTAFEFWGVGFLAMVVFQFWITVRGRAGFFRTTKADDETRSSAPPL
jgi:hypothetical protein